MENRKNKNDPDGSGWEKEEINHPYSSLLKAVQQKKLN
jgi:hypothetical protein